MTSCSDVGGKGVGWGGGVQIFAKPGAIDTSAVARVHLCVEATCVDMPTQEIAARPAKPKPFSFSIDYSLDQDRTVLPAPRKQVKVHVTLRSTSDAVIATGSASSEISYVDPMGWYCDEEIAQRVTFGAGPAIAVEFQSPSRLVAVGVRVPKPSCPWPSW